MSASVRAFQPRKIDPPQCVAGDYDELKELEGEFIGGPQCDGCGCATYMVEVRLIMPGVRQYEAVCKADPDDVDENGDPIHPAPCGTRYLINIWDEDLVTF